MYSIGKRLFDVVLSICLLVILSPLIMLLCLINLFAFGPPLLFSQARPGLHEEIFTMYKFRTMTNEKDENGNLLPDACRLTRWGSFMRSLSLDELPELWNVLRGDMSFVGPRPLLVEYLPRYSEHQKLRHKVRPGITGLAQIMGRNRLSWEEKFDLDVDYVENVTFSRDLKILFQTLVVTIKREGISHGNDATMPPFMGTT